MPNQLATISALIQSGNSESSPLDLSGLAPEAIYLGAAGVGTLVTFAAPFVDLASPTGEGTPLASVLESGMDLQLNLSVGYNLLPSWVKQLRAIQFAYVDAGGAPIAQTADIRFYIVGELRR